MTFLIRQLCQRLTGFCNLIRYKQRMSLNFVKQTVNRRQTTYAGDKYTESHLQLVHLRPVYTYHLRQIHIVCMVMVRMGSVLILSIKQSVCIDTMINGDGHGDGTCKQALTTTTQLQRANIFLGYEHF